MAYKIKKESSVKGLSFTYIEDPKYRGELISVRLLLPLEENTPQIYQMLGTLMVDSTSVYPTKAKMSEKLKSLYGAVQNYNFVRVGDNIVLGFSLYCMSDRFAINGETVTTEAAKLMNELLFSPNVKEGAFDQKYFEMARREIIEAIKSVSNNRHNYAVRRAREVAFEGEPASLPPFGTIEAAEKLTAEQLYREYKKMLSIAGISVTFCGSGHNTEAQKIVKERITEFAEKRLAEHSDEIIVKDSVISPSPLRAEVKEVREKIEQEQLKLVMGFKTEGGDFYAEKLACMLFGGTDFSKLFTNVREKLSLCYYCQSFIMDFKQTMFVDSGVDAANEQLARQEILHQLDLLKKGDFTDEELENCKKSLRSSLRIVTDVSEDFNSWNYLRSLRGIDITPEQEIALVNEVTRERVIKAANGFIPDCVYVLEPETVNGGEQE